MTTTQKQTDQEIFNETGIWEGWMKFDGMTCNAAFNVGYNAGESGDAMPENFKHAAIVAAWKDGKRQYSEEN